MCLKAQAELMVHVSDNSPYIICLQETKLGTNCYYPGLDYNIYTSSPINDRAKGDVAVIAHKSL